MNQTKTVANISASQAIVGADRALQTLVRVFREDGSPEDLEDALQVVHDAKRALLDLTKRVRERQQS